MLKLDKYSLLSNIYLKFFLRVNLNNFKDFKWINVFIDHYKIDLIISWKEGKSGY